MAERAIKYIDAHDSEGLEKFYEKNQLNSEDVDFVIKYIKEIREEPKKHIITAGSPNAKLFSGNIDDYIYSSKPPMDGDYGRIYVKGEGVDVIPWTSENSEYPQEIVESYHIQNKDFNGTRFLMDLDFEEEAPKWFFFMQLAHQALRAIDWYSIDIDILNIDGQRKAVIKYTDSAWTDLKKTKGDTTIDIENGIEITLNKRHKENEFGYIYVENGKAVFKPIVYPGDKYMKVIDGKVKDITYQFEEPLELSDDMIKEINKMFIDQGVGIELPYN